MTKEEINQYLRNNLNLVVSQSDGYATISITLENECISTVDIQMPSQRLGFPV